MTKYRGVDPAPQPRLAQLRRNEGSFAADGSLAEDGNAGVGGQHCWFGRAVIVINGVTRHMRRRNRELARRIPGGALPGATLRIQDRVNRPCRSSQRDIGSPDWRTKARVRRTIRRRCSGVSFVRIQLRQWIYSCPPTRTWSAQQHAQPSSHSRAGLAVTMARDEPSVAA